MVILIAGLLIFFSGHSIGLFPDLRERLISTLGPKAFRGAYSLVALVGLGLIVYGFSSYRMYDYQPVWDPPVQFRHLNLVFMLIAFVMLASAGGPANHIKAILKHPMLAGIKTWAFGHLLANGDLGGIVLFGSFLVFAVIDRMSLKRRPQATMPSALPTLRGDVLAIAKGGIAYAAMLFLHPWLIGVAVLP